ncbi:Asparagine synthase [Flavobacteriaceae bacterium MAR_2010_105]|nr:Asparagine synthase [Flavobacteriaceae bacterium MAR_2010_105]
MTTLQTPIIPTRPTFAKVKAPHELNLEAICVFTAIGFFLDQDTYWTDEVVLRPASHHTLDPHGVLIDSKPWFQWHYTPRNISFDEALDEFSTLFEAIIDEQTKGKKVILPLSGGLDSRTQATAFKQLGTAVLSYSYQFENGYPETKIAKHIAESCNFGFQKYTIPKGYLWEQLDTLAEINGCYSDFTSPRQMALHTEFPKFGGDLFSLGHWGDVLFDSADVPQLNEQQELDLLSKKLLKKGGLELATALWKAWGLDGDFYEYFQNRLAVLLKGIAIENTNAKLRAFKSLYWAPRWTSVNLSVFEQHLPVSLPYYDDRMCRFICTVPEAYLKGRQLQIAYIKQRAPELAKITWQDQRPFSLHTYHRNRAPFNLPYRLSEKIKRTLKSVTGNPYVQRNWELQFLGPSNKEQLLTYLDVRALSHWIPESLTTRVIQEFYEHPEPKTAHPLNMLLVLSKFDQLDPTGSSRQVGTE